MHDVLGQDILVCLRHVHRLLVDLLEESEVLALVVLQSEIVMEKSIAAEKNCVDNCVEFCAENCVCRCVENCVEFFAPAILEQKSR